MVLSKTFILLLLFLLCVLSSAKVYNKSAAGSHVPLHGIELPDHPSFNSVTSSIDTGCRLSKTTRQLESSRAAEKEEEDDNEDEDMVAPPAKPALKLHLKHRQTNTGIENSKKASLMSSAHRDLTRIQTLHTRITEKKNQNTLSRITETKKQKLQQPPITSMALKPESDGPTESVKPTSQLVATLESGVSLGSGEYFMDVFVGTPPKHFSLILDTGSDLNWIQCLPCHDCFEQNGPPYNPKDSSSFRNVSCHDPRCSLVSSPDPPLPCKSDNQTCPYFYWYGDQSNTTGDFALETFTVNLTSSTGQSEFRGVENVMFGCATMKVLSILLLIALFAAVAIAGKKHEVKADNVINFNFANILSGHSESAHDEEDDDEDDEDEESDLPCLEDDSYDEDLAYEIATTDYMEWSQVDTVEEMEKYYDEWISKKHYDSKSFTQKSNGTVTGNNRKADKADSIAKLATRPPASQWKVHSLSVSQTGCRKFSAAMTVTEGTDNKYINIAYRFEAKDMTFRERAYTELVL